MCRVKRSLRKSGRSGRRLRGGSVQNGLRCSGYRFGGLVLGRFGGSGRRLRGASLVEALVAAVVLLVVFAATLELLPRLSVRGDDALLTAEAEYRVGRAFDKYGSGLWPAATYAEHYDWGAVTIRVEPYRDHGDLQLVTVTACFDGSGKRIVHNQIVEWRE